jgi:hypothetical protein
MKPRNKIPENPTKKSCEMRRYVEPGLQTEPVANPESPQGSSEDPAKVPPGPTEQIASNRKKRTI